MAVLLDGGDFPTAFPERDRLLCELMYGAGLRVSEAAHIKIEDLRPEQKAILIHGKGGPYGKSAKQRLVPLNPHSRKALDEYLSARVRFPNVETNVLFFAVRNRYEKSSTKIESINVRSIARMLLYMTQVRGLQPMHPHYCATRARLTCSTTAVPWTSSPRSWDT